jgi:hypothetical protein
MHHLSEEDITTLVKNGKINELGAIDTGSSSEIKSDDSPMK